MIHALTMPLLAFIDGGLLLCPFGVVGLALTIFWIWAIIEVATKEPSEDQNKIIWILVVVLVGWIGAAIYFFVRRPERIRKYGR